MMIFTVLGIFKNVSHAEHFLLDAESAGFSLERISCMLHYPESVAKKSAVDASLDVLLKLNNITIPNAGTLLIGGPIAVSFGLTGATQATITGAATGLVAGGIAGGFIGLGISQSFAVAFEKHIHEGKILLGIPATEEQIPFIKTLLSHHIAIQSAVIKTPTHQFSYLLSSVVFQQPSQPHFQSLVGVKGGKKSKSQSTKKPKGT